MDISLLLRGVMVVGVVNELIKKEKKNSGWPSSCLPLCDAKVGVVDGGRHCRCR